MHYYLYEIKNNLNGKIYVGAHETSNIDDGYMGSGKIIKRSIKKNGVENFTKLILRTYSSAEEMYAQEAEIVNEEFIARDDTYNIKLGGQGGFDYINNNCGNQGARLNAALTPEQRYLGGKNAGKKNAAKWKLNPESRHLTFTKEFNVEMRKRAQSEEAKAKRKESFNRIGHSQGNKNSQFGKIWISNVLTKEVARITINDTIPEGWVKGKKGYVPKRIWVNNSVVENCIAISKKQEFLNNGFTCGRLNWSPHKRIVV